MNLDLAAINAEWGQNPEQLIAFALKQAKPALCTTNFRPFEAVLLHMLCQQQPDIQVLWIDSGYNTEATYRFADELTQKLKLNLITYLPKRSRAHREAIEGELPALNTPAHAAFTEEVKLEPFARALREISPKLWFTALRASDTALRAKMQPLSVNPDGLLKVAPLLYWSSKDLHEYLVKHDLPNNLDYFDPTKGEENRECGLHINH